MSAMGSLIKMPGLRPLPSYVPKREAPVMDVMILDPAELQKWKRPPAQRPLKITPNVADMAAAMQLEAAENGDDAWCTIPDVIKLGKVGKETYLYDGQHRLDGAFLLACGPPIVVGGVTVKAAMANVMLTNFDNLGELGIAFADSASQLVATRPDDILRALSGSSRGLQLIAASCPFIGYDRAGEHAKTTYLSMSAACRTWFGSGGLVPAAGPRARECVKLLSDEQTAKLIDFYTACQEAGWVSEGTRRLWSTLNLGINQWLWRRVVLGDGPRHLKGGPLRMALTREQYVSCMKELTTSDYGAWLSGRSLRYQDRNPAYSRIKELFTVRLARYGIEAPRFPMPTDWGST